MSSGVTRSAAVLPVTELRAAFFSDAAPDRNGVGTYYRDLCEHLQARVERAELFCPEQSDDGWRDPICFPLPGDATQKICIPNPRQLRRRFGALQPQAVVVATPAPYGLIGLRLARKHGARVISGFHTHFEKLTSLYWKDKPRTGRLFHWYLENCHRLLFRYSDTVLANSEEMIEIANSIGARNTELMGTTIARPFIDTPVTALRDNIGVVTFAGRLAAEKNLESVIAAAQALPDIQFRIVGTGPQLDLVEEAAARITNLEYAGWVARAQMPEIIDATDMLVLPSRVESFGTIALEAMTRSRTVLVSRECGITQWQDLSPGLFRIAEGEDLAAAIKRVAGLDPALRTLKARRGREAACNLNEWTVNHWLDVLSRGALAGNHG
ncbi:MAG: glycosyltransferase [Gammaproteobacteria bacterium]|nr:glycosyltransferase [Gammaproteobacteria bacterium]